ncbi:MAG: hypothetical protein HY920_01285 [Elusimicrobia bacterium]|nr:hypothetical protein [Elusimicrobiota bacterium]
MEVTNNFFSLVALGNFNPAILKHEFLKNECNLNLPDPIAISPPQFPVISQIRYPNKLELLMELGKFTLVEPLESAINKSMSLEIFEKYIEKLRFTPVEIIGANVNTNIIFTSQDELNNLILVIKDAESIRNFFSSSLVAVNNKIIHKENEDDYRELNYIIPLTDLERYQLNVQKQGLTLVINFNFEITYRNNLGIITQNINNIWGKFNMLVNQLREKSRAESV